MTDNKLGSISTHCMKVILVVLLFVVTASTEIVQGGISQSQLIDVGGYRLNFNVARGTTTQTILFESGGGDDSSVWNDVAPAIGQRTEATVVTYDRAGSGKSEPAPGPYKIDEEVTALERGLSQLGLQKNLVIVAHSYGG